MAAFFFWITIQPTKNPKDSKKKLIYQIDVHINWMFLFQKIISAQCSSLTSNHHWNNRRTLFSSMEVHDLISFNGFMKRTKMWWMQDQPIQYSKDFQGPQQISKFFSGSYCLQMFARLVKLQMHFFNFAQETHWTCLQLKLQVCRHWLVSAKPDLN